MIGMIGNNHDWLYFNELDLNYNKLTTKPLTLNKVNKLMRKHVTIFFPV